MIDQEHVRLQQMYFRLQNLTCLTQEVRSGARGVASTLEVGRPSTWTEAHRSTWNPPNAATLASDQGAAHARRIVSN